MRVMFHELWGCGRGVVSRLAPQTRILCAVLLFASCLLTPIPPKIGVALILAVSVLWLALCGCPWRIVLRSLLLGSLLFLPYFLLLPITKASSGSDGWQATIWLTTGIVVHGLSGMLVAIATVTTLSGSDLREGLLRLPIPALFSRILVQIVHQTASLGYETRRVADAMALRGASGSGMAAWRVLGNLPLVWLPRVLLRAERVADAMDVRGYCEQELPSFEKQDRRWPDVLSLILACLALTLAASMRYLGGS